MLGMKATIESLRALALYTAVQLDRAHAAQDPRAGGSARARRAADSIVRPGPRTGRRDRVHGVQVHGGMATSRKRARPRSCVTCVTAIYEGTTAIQANDLVGRKLARDGGATMSALLDEIEAELKAAGSGDATARHVAAAALDAVALLRTTTRQVMQQFAASVPAALAVAVPYLKLCGCVLGGWLGARAATAARPRGCRRGADVGLRAAAEQPCRPGPAAGARLRRDLPRRRRERAGVADRADLRRPWSEATLGLQYGRALEPTGPEVVERALRIAERVGRHLDAQRQRRGETHELDAVGARQVGDRHEFALAHSHS
jgi:hypothetical protein